MSAARRIAVVGASAELAADVTALLLERGVDEAAIELFDDDRTAGEAIEVGSRRVRVELATPEALASIGAAIFCDDGHLSRRLVPVVARGGGLVVDASPVSRSAPDARLIVPEVNGATVAALGGRGVVASPMPATVALTSVLAPLRAGIGLSRVVTTVLEPASQRGEGAVEELSRQSVWLMQGRGLSRRSGPERLAFNLRPVAASAEGDGWAPSENALVAEVRAVFSDPELDLVATVVRAPVFFGAAQSVVVDLDRAATVDEIAALLRQAPGLLVAGSPEHDAWLTLVAQREDGIDGNDEDQDDDEAELDDEDLARDEDDLESGAAFAEDEDPSGAGGEAPRDLLPGPVDVAGSDLVHVARLRLDPSRPTTVAFWLAFDDVRKGIAVNAVATLQLALGALD
jgi:aspartate-semialdehyde dehydrogenase